MNTWPEHTYRPRFISEGVMAPHGNLSDPSFPSIFQGKYRFMSHRFTVPYPQIPQARLAPADTITFPFGNTLKKLIIHNKYNTWVNIS